MVEGGKRSGPLKLGKSKGRKEFDHPNQLTAWDEALDNWTTSHRSRESGNLGRVRIVTTQHECKSNWLRVVPGNHHDDVCLDTLHILGLTVSTMHVPRFPTANKHAAKCVVISHSR